MRFGSRAGGSEVEGDNHVMFVVVLGGLVACRWCCCAVVWSDVPVRIVALAAAAMNWMEEWLITSTVIDAPTG